MDLQLSGKTVLVTGSTAGIGYATALGFAGENASVIVNGRTQARVNEAVERIRQKVPGAKVSGVAGDLSTAGGCAQLTRAVPRVDVLINNLGIFEPKPFDEIPDSDWLRMFEVNVMSGVRLSRHYLTEMKKQNWGRIIFVSSESAVQIPVEMIHYGMTKTAQIAIARGLAASVKGTGITINSVLAGPTKSEGVATFVAQMAEQKGTDFGTMEKEFFATARPTSLLQRFETTDEIANMILYVASGRASGTNGAALRVDGGVVQSLL